MCVCFLDFVVGKFLIFLFSKASMSSTGEGNKIEVFLSLIESRRISGVCVAATTHTHTHTHKHTCVWSVDIDCE